MNKKVKKSRLIQAFALGLAILLIFVIGPLDLIKYRLMQKGAEKIASTTEAVNPDSPVLQMFVPELESIRSIYLYVCNEEPEMTLQVRIKNAAMEEILLTQVRPEEMKTPGFVEVKLNLAVEPGKDYYYTVEGLGEDAFLAMENTEESGLTVNGAFFYNGDEMPGVNLMARYYYVTDLSDRFVNISCIVIAFAAAVIIIGVQGYYNKWGKDKEVRVSLWVKRIGNPLVILLAAAAAAAVWPMKVFSSRRLDIVVYEAGILMLTAVLLYGINHKRDEAYDQMQEQLPSYRLQDLLQTCFLAGAVWYCTEYVNGLYNHDHYVSFRQMLICLGLSILATYTRKELFRITNYIYAALALAAGFIYKFQFPGVLEEEDLMNMTVAIAVIWGIVLINTVLCIWKRRIRGFKLMYGGLVLLLAALMIVFRQKWVWPIIMSVMMLLYYLRFSAWERKKMFLPNLCNAILLSFGYMTAQTLIHRPYHYYIYYRYAMMYSAPTSAGVYLSVCFSAALAKLFMKYRFSRRLCDVWKELFFCGMIFAYLTMTLSRTGYLAVLCSGFLLLIVTSAGKAKERLKTMGMEVLLLLLAVVWCMAPVFTATRTVPAVANDPYIYDIEYFVDTIYPGDKPDSRKYMTVSRFVQVFNMKILGMDEEEAMIFGMQAGDYRGFMKDDLVYVASAEGDAGLEQSQEGDISNGRFAIFEMYLKNMNWTGHDKMSVDGKVSHAHNIYLQSAYDHGIAVGILLFLVCGTGILVSILFYKRKRHVVYYAEMPLAVTTAFMAAGMVEWVFHPCNPLCLSWLLVLAPLLFDMRDKNKNEKRKQREKKQKTV